MSTLVEKLTAEGQGESAGFLNDLVKMLWPNIDRAASKMIKEIVDPMFKSMLPSPFSSLHFTKVELGNVPFTLSNVKTIKTDHDGINLLMNVDWDGKCDMELDGNMIPALGVEHVKLQGRLSVLLCPITDVIPLIGAAQISFVNPPLLKLDFTGAANVADFSAVDDSVRGVILSIINSMFTLPNRYLVKMDANNEYFKTYMYPMGVLRITVEKAWGFAEEAKGTAKKLFSKITRAAPDCYVKLDLGAEPTFRTTTLNNKVAPNWNETKDIVVSDFDQCIKVDVYDHDANSDDQVGEGVTTVREILTKGGRQELPLTADGKETGGVCAISCQYFSFAADTSSFSASSHKGEGMLSGLATVLVANATGVKGERSSLKPSVVVTWGSGQENRYQTAIKEDAAGTDINNPSYDQSFRLPVSADKASSKQDFRIALMNGEKEIGGVNVPFGDVMKAPDMKLAKAFDVGGGAKVKASICLRGVTQVSMQEMNLPDRGR